MPIDPKKVLEWLAKAGYPLEYEAARQLRGMGFVAEQGRHFVDPIEAKSREIDVLAHAAITGQTTMFLVVECKTSKDKPWVVYTTEQAAPPVWHAIATKQLTVGLQRSKWREQLAAVLKLTRPLGFRVTEARDISDHDQQRRDRAYEAMEQAVSAAVGLTQDDPRSWFALPVVVVDGELFRLAVPEPGQDDLQPVDWYRVRWHGAQAHPFPTAVDVVRASFLAEYAKEMRFTFGEAVQICDLAWADAAPRAK